MSSHFSQVIIIACFASAGWISIARADSITSAAATFKMGAPEHCGGHTWCAMNAMGAMQKSGLKTTKVGNDLLTGSKPTAEVVISCIRQDDHSMATLVASSANQDEAYRTRDALKNAMTKAGCL